MNPTQSNCQQGKIVRTSGADLTGKEGYLCLLAAVAGALVVLLPAAITDVPGFILDDDGVSGDDVSIDPLSRDRQYRIPGKGVIQPGAALVLAAIAGADAGKVRQLPVTTGTYRVIARCEEKAATADGQFVLCRPSEEGNVVVA
jgi:hypothetical protein